jgi:hypothetical protein
MITLIEYTTSDSKPTGRICRIPDVNRQQLTDLLMLYGFTGEYGEYTGRLEAYHPAHWCFVYNGSMGHHPGEQVELYELIAP